MLATNKTSGQVGFRPPENLYVSTAELEAYFDGNPNAWFAHVAYSDDTIKFLVRDEVGVAKSVRIKQGRLIAMGM